MKPNRFLMTSEEIVLNKNKDSKAGQEIHKAWQRKDGTWWDNVGGKIVPYTPTEKDKAEAKPAQEKKEDEFKPLSKEEKEARAFEYYKKIHGGADKTEAEMKAGFDKLDMGRKARYIDGSTPPEEKKAEADYKNKKGDHIPYTCKGVNIYPDALQDAIEQANGDIKTGNHWGSAELNNKTAQMVAFSSAKEFKPIDRDFKPSTFNMSSGAAAEAIKMRNYAQNRIAEVSREEKPEVFRGMSVSKEQLDSLISGKDKEIAMTGATAMTFHRDIMDRYSASEWTQGFGEDKVGIKMIIQRDDKVDHSFGMWHDCNDDKKKPAFELLSGLGKVEAVKYEMKASGTPDDDIKKIKDTLDKKENKAFIDSTKALKYTTDTSKLLNSGDDKEYMYRGVYNQYISNRISGKTAKEIEDNLIKENKKAEQEVLDRKLKPGEEIYQKASLENIKQANNVIRGFFLGGLADSIDSTKIVENAKKLKLDSWKDIVNKKDEFAREEKNVQKLDTYKNLDSLTNNFDSKQKAIIWKLLKNHGDDAGYNNFLINAINLNINEGKISKFSKEQNNAIDKIQSLIKESKIKAEGFQWMIENKAKYEPSHVFYCKAV